MSSQTWSQALVTAQADGPALASSTAQTSLLPTPALYTLPANFFSTIGQAMRIRASGRISSTATPTMTFGVGLGTLATPIIAFSSGAISLITGQTNITWELEALLTLRALGNGTASNLMGIGRFLCAAATTPVNLLPASAPAVGTGFDCTLTNLLNLFGTWSASSASNSITLHEYVAESLN